MRWTLETLDIVDDEGELEIARQRRKDVEP
jgi:hypothetical protein